MLSACIAIVVILVVTVFMMRRAGNRTMAIAILPLGFVPTAHIIGFALELIIRFPATSLELVLMHVGLDIAALVLSCIMLVFFSLKFESKSGRNTFLVSCGIFELVLTLALVADIVKPVINQIQTLMENGNY